MVPVTFETFDHLVQAVHRNIVYNREALLNLYATCLDCRLELLRGCQVPRSFPPINNAAKPMGIIVCRLGSLAQGAHASPTAMTVAESYRGMQKHLPACYVLYRAYIGCL